jgi:hypothetical protein
MSAAVVLRLGGAIALYGALIELVALMAARAPV